MSLSRYESTTNAATQEILTPLNHSRIAGRRFDLSYNRACQLDSEAATNISLTILIYCKRLSEDRSLHPSELLLADESTVVTMYIEAELRLHPETTSLEEEWSGVTDPVLRRCVMLAYEVAFALTVQIHRKLQNRLNKRAASVSSD